MACTGMASQFSPLGGSPAKFRSQIHQKRGLAKQSGIPALIQLQGIARLQSVCSNPDSNFSIFELVENMHNKRLAVNEIAREMVNDGICSSKSVCVTGGSGGSKHPEIETSSNISCVGPSDRVLFQLGREIRQAFPNVFSQQSGGASSYTASWSWLPNYIRTKNRAAAEPDEYKRFCIMDEYLERVKAFKSLVERISNDFECGPPKYQGQATKNAMDQICGDMLICKASRGITFICGEICYMRDTFFLEAENQAKYQKWMCKSFTDPKDVEKRNKLVEWVLYATKTLNYPSETSHLAVYYVDVYLRIKGNRITDFALYLVGVTAIHIAGKTQFAVPAKLQRLVTMSNRFYKLEEVIWMERQILETLEFDLYPPLAPVFVSLILLGGSLKFPALNIRRLAMDLSMGILQRSLLNDKFHSIYPMDKAKAALEIAVEFIFYQYPACIRRDMSDYSYLNSEPGLALGEVALRICTEAFTNRFTDYELSFVVPTMNCTESPVKAI